MVEGLTARHTAGKGARQERENATGSFVFSTSPLRPPSHWLGGSVKGFEKRTLALAFSKDFFLWKLFLASEARHKLPFIYVK